MKMFVAELFFCIVSTEAFSNEQEVELTADSVHGKCSKCAIHQHKMVIFQVQISS